MSPVVALRLLLSRILPPSARNKLALLALLTTVSGVIELVGVGLVIPFIAFAAKMAPFGLSSSLMNRLLELISKLGVREGQVTLALGGIFLVGIGLANTSLVLYQYVALRIVYQEKAHLIRRVAQSISRRSITWYDQQNSSDLSKSVMTDVALTLEYTNAAIQVLSISVRGLVVYIFFLVALPRLAILTAVLLTGSYWAVFHFIHRPLLRAGKRANDVDAALYRLTSELVSGARELKVTNTSDFVVQDLAEAAHRGVQPQIVRGMPGFITRAVLETFTVASVIALLIYFNWKDGNLANGLPMLSAYALAGIRLIPAVQQGLYFIVQMRFYEPSIERVALLLGDPTHGEPTQCSTKPISFHQNISLVDISYSYTMDRPILRNLSLEINKKQRVAVVGETGAGKSTLVDLLLGLRFPQAGTLEVDNVPITAANCLSWRRLIGYVPQSIYLRDACLAENVAFGIPSKDIDMARVELACKAACLHDFILTLPEGYQTEVGERGVRLSGGQSQRTAIARALYHDPEVVIFDEATSALDNVTEGQVLQALDSLKGVKTLIVIAHRLNTIWDFDRIFVLEQGKLVGQGTAQELLENCLTFQKLAERQHLLESNSGGVAEMRG